VCVEDLVKEKGRGKKERENKMGRKKEYSRERK